MPNEHEDVWANTSDGALLKQLFGYYPTLHDARIREVSIFPDKDRVEMLLDYCDLASDDKERDLHVRIRLVWEGIRELKLPWGETDLLGLEFARKPEGIVTRIETEPGLFGGIVSGSVEVFLSKLDPGPVHEGVWLRYL